MFCLALTMLLSACGPKGHATTESPASPTTPTPAPSASTPQVSANPLRDEAHIQEYCKLTAEAAGYIMVARQRGKDLAEVMEAAESAEMKAFAVEAYESPRYRTPEHQKRAIEDFRNDAFLKCFKSGG